MIGMVQLAPNGKWWTNTHSDSKPYTEGKGHFQTKEAAEGHLRRLGYNVLPFREFWLAYMRRFFRQPDLTWEQAVELSGWDPGSSRPRRSGMGRGSSTTGGAIMKRVEALKDIGVHRGRQDEEGDRPAGEDQERTTPHRQEPSGGRTDEVQPAGGEGVGGVDDWISPVQYAKLRRIPPQYVYGRIRQGKLKTKGERPKMILKSQADRIWGPR